MKIKGVSTGKTRGTTKGDPIEFSPAEKFPLAVKEAVRDLSTLEEARWAELVTITSSHFTPRAVKQAGSFQNNAYEAKGTVKVRVHHHKTDRLFRATAHDFKIEFEDCLDAHGIPDLKITKFTM